MARKQSSIISYNGMNHKEIYFKGHYHDKMYIGEYLVWEKLNDQRTKHFAPALYSVFKNTLYGWGIVQNDSSQNLGYALCYYDYSDLGWKKLCDTTVSFNSYIMTANDKYVLFRNNDRYTYLSFDGSVYNLPTNSVSFLGNHNGEARTNKGRFAGGNFSGGYKIRYLDYSNNVISEIPLESGYALQGFSAVDGVLHGTFRGNGNNLIKLLTVEDDVMSVVSNKVFPISSGYPQFLFSTVRWNGYNAWIDGQVRMLDGDFYVNKRAYFNLDNGTPFFTNSDSNTAYEYLIAGGDETRYVLARRISGTTDIEIRKNINEANIRVYNPQNYDLRYDVVILNDREGKAHLFWHDQEITDDGHIVNLNDFYNMYD